MYNKNYKFKNYNFRKWFYKLFCCFTKCRISRKRLERLIYFLSSVGVEWHGLHSWKVWSKSFAQFFIYLGLKFLRKLVISQKYHSLKFVTTIWLHNKSNHVLWNHPCIGLFVLNKRRDCFFKTIDKC